MSQRLSLTRSRVCHICHTCANAALAPYPAAKSPSAPPPPPMRVTRLSPCAVALLYAHSVNAARTSIEKADAPESHTRISGGLPGSQCCTGCTTWTYTDNVVNAPRPPPPPNSRPYDPKGDTRDAGGSGGLSTQGQKMLVIFLVPGCVFLLLSLLVVLRCACGMLCRVR